MKNQSFKIVLKKKISAEDLEEMLGDLTDSEIWEFEKKKGYFLVHYLGIDKIKIKDISKILGKDCKVKEIPPIYKICEACGGIGNIDEGAGFPLDCIKCNGSGWRKKTKQ